MRTLISIFFLLFFSFLSAYVAKKRGRDPVAWFLIGILLGVFAPIILMILKPLNAEEPVVESKDEALEVKEPTIEETELLLMAKEWFYMDQGHKQQGPIGYSILKSLWKDEKINSKTYVWSEGMVNWSKIQDLPDMHHALEGYQEYPF